MGRWTSPAICAKLRPACRSRRICCRCISFTGTPPALWFTLSCSDNDSTNMDIQKTKNSEQDRHQSRSLRFLVVWSFPIEENSFLLPLGVFQRLRRATPGVSHIGNDCVAFSSHPLVAPGDRIPLWHGLQGWVEGFIVAVSRHAAVQIRQNKDQPNMRMLLFQFVKNRSAQMIKPAISAKVKFICALCDQVRAYRIKKWAVALLRKNPAVFRERLFDQGCQLSYFSLMLASIVMHDIVDINHYALNVFV